MILLPSYAQILTLSLFPVLPTHIASLSTVDMCKSSLDIYFSHLDRDTACFWKPLCTEPFLMFEMSCGLELRNNKGIKGTVGWIWWACSQYRPKYLGIEWGHLNICQMCRTMVSVPTCSKSNMMHYLSPRLIFTRACTHLGKKEKKTQNTFRDLKRDFQAYSTQVAI